MKLKFLATGQAPDFYEFSGETITAHHGGVSESVDFSQLEHGDIFEGIEPESLTLPASQIIRAAHRDEDGILHVTLCQKVGAGDWTESIWIDVSEFVQGRQYVRRVLNGEPVENVYPAEEEEL